MAGLFCFPFRMSFRKYTKIRFSCLDTVDILDQIVAYLGGETNCPLHCRIFSHILGLCSLNVSRNLLIIKTVGIMEVSWGSGYSRLENTPLTATLNDKNGSCHVSWTLLSLLCLLTHLMLMGISEKCFYYNYPHCTKRNQSHLRDRLSPFRGPYFNPLGSLQSSTIITICPICSVKVISAY